MPAFSIASFVAGIGPSPMISFGTPATAYDTSRAIGLCSAARAASASASTKKAAPSLMPDALPAVTVPPSFLNAGRILASVSTVVSGLTCSSVSNVTSPLRVFLTIGTICVLEAALGDRRRGAPVRLGGQRVLLLAA